MLLSVNSFLESMIHLPYGFTPRDYQRPVLEALDSGYRRAVLCWHRRSGKDLTMFNYMISRMLREVGVYFYVFPTYKQGKKVLWDNITIDGRKYLDFIPQKIIERKNNVEMKVSFVNGSLMQVVGSNDYDALMGTNPRGIVLSEYALQDKQAWEYIRPILKVNKGWAVFVSTPRGKNHFYDLYNIGRNDESWFSEVLSVKDTGILSEEDIENEKREGMSEHMVEQEYYCSFDVGCEGSYYSKYIDKMNIEDRIGFVPADNATVVHTAWDLGMSDSTAIIFFQVSGMEIRIVDYYENSGEGMAHYAKVLQARDYVYGKHFAPHDIEVRELSTGISRRSIAKGLGINFDVVAKTSVIDGIETVRSMFPRFFIDAIKCKWFIKCIEAYRKDYDANRDVYSERPYHDFSSHAADALRYMCQGIQQHLSYVSMSEERADELERMYYRRI